MAVAADTLLLGTYGEIHAGQEIPTTWADHLGAEHDTDFERLEDLGLIAHAEDDGDFCARTTASPVEEPPPADPDPGEVVAPEGPVTEPAEGPTAPPVVPEDLTEVTRAQLNEQALAAGVPAPEKLPNKGAVAAAIAAATQPAA